MRDSLAAVFRESRPAEIEQKYKAEILVESYYIKNIHTVWYRHSIVERLSMEKKREQRSRPNLPIPSPRVKRNK